jgi:hypothetical protein
MTTEELKGLTIAKSWMHAGLPARDRFWKQKSHRHHQCGRCMEVLSADEGTKIDIPKWCTKQGHEYLGSIDENGYFKVYLRKK